MSGGTREGASPCEHCYCALSATRVRVSPLACKFPQWWKSCERGGAPCRLVPHLSLARTLPLLCSLAQPRATSPRADDPSSRARNIKTMLRSAQGVLWDVDGTLVESTDLAFVATNEVLEANGRPQITVEQYKVGCKFTTPERCAPSPSGA